MRQCARLVPIAAFLPLTAQAQPSFKRVPGGDSDPAGGETGAGFGLDLDFALPDSPWLQSAAQFLAGSFGYIAVGLVLLLLLMALLAARRAERPQADDGELFDPDEGGRFGDSR